MRSFLAIGALVVVCSACGNDSTGPVPTPSPAPSPSSQLQIYTNTTPPQTPAAIRVGQSLEIYTSNPSVQFAQFRSSNTDVVTVPQVTNPSFGNPRILNCTGTHNPCVGISAKAAGTATVTFTDSAVSGQVSNGLVVTVTP